jgi:hypothetical protein
MTVPDTGSPIRRRPRSLPGALEAGALLGEDQTAVLVLLGEDEASTSSPSSHLVDGSTDLRMSSSLSG